MSNKKKILLSGVVLLLVGILSCWLLIDSFNDSKSDWELYENNAFKIKHPSDCWLKDITSLNSNGGMNDDLVYLINVCHTGHDTLGGSISVTTRAEEDVIKTHSTDYPNDNQAVVSSDKIKFNGYPAHKITKRNETTSTQYSTIIFSHNNLTFEISGSNKNVDLPNSGKINTEEIISTFEVK